MKEYRIALNKYNRYFEGYNHNIPVIYSTLEGQYQGVIYCDDEEEIAILVAKFDFIFIGGNIENKKAEEIINDIIFNELVQRQQRKEIIVFGQNEKWDSVLSRVSQGHHGVSDLRKCYKLDQVKFKKIYNENKLNNVSVVIKYEQDNDSSVDYPVSRVFINDLNVSFCSAFMLAKGYAEIDVATEEDFRRKGYAKIGAIALINELISQDIEPNWCTWPYRLESQALALSIGFKLDKEVPAYIWVDEFGF
jgi:hypothetical protein